MHKVVKVALLSLLLTSFSALPTPAQAATTDCTVESNTKCVVTFSFTGAPETWTVPSGITEVYFDVRGAQGGGTSGGQGGIDTGTMTVTGGSNLIVRVGGQGTLGLTAAGGFNGGGSTSAGDTAPGSGGGASDIRLNADTLAARVVVAGGGGGQSTYCGNISQPARNPGGAGGGLIGAAGGGGSGCWSSAYGGGGTQTAGGGTFGYVNGNSAGSLGQGGQGKGVSAGGGGGGGGYYGGGGAAVGAGGGGSSYVDTRTVTSFTLQQGGRTGNGIVTITYLNFQNSSVSLSVSSTPLFRTAVNLTATSSQSGRVTFFANGKKIPLCIQMLLSSTATCSWTPSARGAVTLRVELRPSGPFYSSQSAINVSVGRRSGLR
jgi:hypothetical protein